MHKLNTVVSIAVLIVAFSSGAQGYSATATVNFSWSTNGKDVGWTASGAANVLGGISNSTYYSTLTGNNSTNYLNSDFASVAQCASIVAGIGGTPTSTRKYGCRYNDPDENPSFVAIPIPTDGAGNLGPGAQAAGTITVTDTTLTGVLTILATTDEPTGATANSVGNGSNGYNLRQADGSPFGNSWGGVTTAGTYTLNLTGTFTDTSWQITGGGARFNDPGYLCQQGGTSSPANILCNPSTAPGGFTTTGGSLSWGWDPDGNGAGTSVTEIDVRDTSNVTIALLSGVLANLSVDAVTGAITTNQGEIRRALGAGAGCGSGAAVKNITYDAGFTRISCGTLTAANLVVTGTAEVVPTPDPFSFVDQVNVPLATVITSNTITVTGAISTKNISVANGEYSLGCTEAFTQAPGTIAPGGAVCVRQTSATTPATTTTTTLTIGGTSGVFAVTTFPADTTPEFFTFIDQTNVALATLTTSAPVFITGLNAGTPIAVANGQYSIGCTGTFTVALGTISNDQTVCVRQTSSPAPDTTTDTVLTIGGVSDTFSVTTVPADTTPDPFAFVDRVDVQEGTVITSAPVTITGINTPAPISVLGGTYSIGCGATFTGVAGSISNGASVCVRHTSAISQTTETSTTLNIGGVSDTFTSTTVLTFATRNDSATTLVNTPVQINVLANDVGYSDPVTLSIFTPPTGGTAVVTGSPGVQAGVRITYTPAAGFQGTDSFVYAVEDNALSGTATVTVTVTSDADGDGILDSVDNCLGVSNSNQRDTNGDGYGNICDPDFNNNGIVDSQDGALLKARFGSTTHPDQDLNGNGIVDSNDGARLKVKFGRVPGPSGLRP